MFRKIYFLGLIVLASCGSKFHITEEYIYNSKGFSSNLSLTVLGVVDSFDIDGLPVNAQKLLRIDLHHSQLPVKKKIFFFKENDGYYWQVFLSNERYNTLPIKFEKGKWYSIWGGNMESGMFNENYHSFFLYIDSTGKMNVHERVIQDNL